MGSDSAVLRIRRIDSRKEDIRAAMAELRRKLSPRGDVVSQAGRQRTIEIFGQPLSPAEVVARICRDVDQRGLAAVLDYSARIDKAELSASTLRVPEDELARAHAAADAEFLAAIRRVRDNIRVFQEAILHRDVRVEATGRVPGRALPAAGPRGHLRAGRRGGVSVHGADDGRARPGGRRWAAGPGRPADEVRRLQSRPLGHLP